jgi:aconitase A
LVLGNDSHTPTLGAAGAVAFASQPVGVALAVHTGRVVMRVPHTVRVRVSGRLSDGVSMRDAALTLLNELTGEGGVPLAAGACLEFCGEALTDLTQGQKAVLANIAPEAVAATALLTGGTEDDTGTVDIHLNLASITPRVSAHPNPRRSSGLAPHVTEKVDRVFVGTCSGGTFEEIAAFAGGLSGTVTVPTQVTPATRTVAEALRDAGILKTLEASGVRVTPPGCGACFGFGIERLQPGEVAVTTGNRNTPGRMGSPSARIHLAAGRTAAHAAMQGRVPKPAVEADDRRELQVTVPEAGNLVHAFGTFTTDDLTPSHVPGVGSSNDRDPAVLRGLLFHHLNPQPNVNLLNGRWLVADHAFGMGSNRASSVLALLEAGIAGVLARSFSPLYRAGARDSGLPAVVIDASLHRALRHGSQADLDLDAGVLVVDGERFNVPPESEYERAVRKHGGVLAMHTAS